MADYEIIAVRVGIGKGRSHRVDAVKIGESLFLADQIIGWISAGTHGFGCARRTKRSTSSSNDRGPLVVLT